MEVGSSSLSKCSTTKYGFLLGTRRSDCRLTPIVDFAQVMSACGTHKMDLADESSTMGFLFLFSPAFFNC